MSLCVRNHTSGITSRDVGFMKQVFHNAITNVLPRMIVMDLIHDDTYIEFKNLPIKYVNGDRNIAKITLGDLSQDDTKVLGELYEYYRSRFPRMGMREFSRTMKFVLKRKWYRAFDTNGNELSPSVSVVSLLEDELKNCGDVVYANIQVHVRAMRTHKSRILFEPIVRKIALL
jgi:hypothetical protein